MMVKKGYPMLVKILVYGIKLINILFSPGCPLITGHCLVRLNTMFNIIFKIFLF